MPDVIYAQSKFVYVMDHETTLADGQVRAKKGQTFDNAARRCICCENLFTSKWY